MSPLMGFKLPETEAEPAGVLSSEPDQVGTPPEYGGLFIAKVACQLPLASVAQSGVMIQG